MSETGDGDITFLRSELLLLRSLVVLLAAGKDVCFLWNLETYCSPFCTLILPTD
jgi:hypothetical protein